MVEGGIRVRTLRHHLFPNALVVSHTEARPDVQSRWVAVDSTIEWVSTLTISANMPGKITAIIAGRSWSVHAYSVRSLSSAVLLEVLLQTWLAAHWKKPRKLIDINTFSSPALVIVLQAIFKQLLAIGEYVTPGCFESDFWIPSYIPVLLLSNCIRKLGQSANYC